MMDDPVWRRGLGALARHDFVLDLMLYPPQKGEALRLVRDFPYQPFVLNHCGSPVDRSEDGMRLWAFGPERAMFASDHPVSGLHATFDAIYGAFRAIVRDFSFGEQAAMFFETANRIYRMSLDRAAFPERSIP